MKNVALVLSSGGARGIAHIGVINHLLESGYKITSVSGTSMGALVGGMYAKGSLPDFTEWLLHFTKMDVIRFMDLAVGSGGLIKGEKIVKTLEGFIGQVNIEDLPIPYACVASDLQNRSEVIYRQGDLLKAIRASISIPTVFKPLITDGMMLVDGGVLNPIPLNVIKRNPGDIVIAVNVNAETGYTPPAVNEQQADQERHFSKMRAVLNERWSEMIDTYLVKKQQSKTSKEKQVKLFDVISDSIRLAQDRITTLMLEKYPPDILVNVSYNIGSILDFYKTEEIIQEGRRSCAEALANYRA